AKIDAGQMSLTRQEKDLVEILKHIVVSNQVLVKDKPVEILLEEATEIPMVYIDPIRINQIMLNIVGNAIKFTEEGSVTVRYGMHNEDYVIVEIIDTGIGMSEEQLSVAFERFRQVDGSSTRRAGGTGLGLTITSQLVEMHGGDIGVTSKVGEGSRFYFTIPTVEAGKAHEAEMLALHADGTPESEPVAGD
ncbi:MAG: ATP-binding protein, partial [Chloroflexota bacterium]